MKSILDEIKNIFKNLDKSDIMRTGESGIIVVLTKDAEDVFAAIFGSEQRACVALADACKADETTRKIVVTAATSVMISKSQDPIIQSIMKEAIDYMRDNKNT